jgi:N-acetylmuramoyl-L-alanine amidase
MAASTPSSSPRPGAESRPGRILQTAFSVAFLLATLFTGFSPKMFTVNLGSLLSGVITPVPGSVGSVPTTTQPLRIGIVSGHWGNGIDPGAVCPDGINEHDVNLAIASLVRQQLEANGYTIDLLQEFDPRLDGYKAALLLSIHSDTCDQIDAQATGFKVAASTYSHDQVLAERLTACMNARYAAVTGLQDLSSSITENMTDYHAFSAIDSSTPAAIIETGFLYLDRDLLVNHPDVVANGITAGVLCFVKSENIELTPTP